jgi:hypothetical protein
LAEAEQEEQIMIVRSFWACMAATALLACGGEDDAAISTASLRG